MSYRPILLGMLNMILPGAGYVFVVRRRIFGVLLLSSTVLSLGARGFGFDIPLYRAGDQTATVFEWLSLILITLAFGIDAYMEAKKE